MASGYLPAANAYFNQAPQQFPGSSIAGFTPLQQQSWASGMQGANNLAQAGTGAYNQYQQDSQLGKQGNPWIDTQVQNMFDSANRGFQRNTIPGISDAATQSGQGMGRYSNSGNTRAGIAQGLAASDMNRQLTDSAANMYSNAYGQGLNYTASMNQMSPNMLNMLKLGQLAPSQMAADIGGQQQGMNQQRLTEGRNMWDSMYNAPYEKLTNYQNIVEPGQVGGSITRPIGDTASNIMGGAMMGNQLGSSLYNAWAPSAASSAPATNYNAPTASNPNAIPINTPWGGR